MLSATGSFAASYQIWPSTTTPTLVDVGSTTGGQVELGVSFKSDVSGYVTGIRFYKSVNNTGTHIGNLWSSTGTLLASATFTNETASGWQQVNFANPVLIQANTRYVASYYCPAGHYSDDRGYFATQGVDNAPLHALQDTSATPDGPFTYASSSQFPASTYQSSNYWVDVVFTPATTTTKTIWPSTATPSLVDVGSTTGGQVELGVSFKSDASGYVTGIRFYKGVNNTGTHMGNLWSSTGTLLASATFTNETASGWQQVNFANPVLIQANTRYVASYYCPAGHYSDDRGYFATQGVDNAPLHALQDTSATPDGPFTYASSSQFPASTYQSSNYWVDVVFSPSGGSAAVGPVITTQPANQTVTPGQTATFSVTASGTTPLGYQWRRNGSAITGATSSGYTTPATATSDSGAQFTVVVSNSVGSAISNAATLTVNTPAVAPSITSQPISKTIIAGQTATFSVMASGTTPLSYQWRRNGTAISGATSSSYKTPTNATSDNGAQFTVVVSNSAGNVTSNAATLTVNAATYVLNANPTSLSFGNVNVGSSSKQNVTFTNGGNSSVTVSNVSVNGPGYNVSGISTGQVIAPGQSATLSVTFAPSASGSATGSASVTSNAGNSPATASLGGSGVSQTSSSRMPICGLSGDISIHVPTDWGTFVPPGKGQSYVDPTFGCMVTRITDASSEEWEPGCNSGSGCYMPLNMGYATVSPFNANDTYLLLTDGWNRYFVTDLAGNIVVPISNMPGMNDGWTLWDAANPSVFYYTSGNMLMKGTIGGSRVSTAVVHQFSEYAAINFMAETDVSQDGAHVVMIGGDNSGGGAENVFDYNFVTNTKGPVYTTSCVGVINNTENNCLHKLIQTPDNNIIIQFAGDGSGPEQGNRLWTGATPLPHLQDATNHLDAGYDLNGNAVFIEIGNSYVLSGETNPCPSGWGTEVRQVYNNLGAASCLIDIDRYGQLSNEHVGYRGDKNQPWVGLSFFDSRNPSPEWFGNTGNYVAPSASNWQLYEDEIVLVRIDANNNSSLAYRVARAYSRSNENFYAQPHAAISRDGRYLAFNSNMAYAQSGCPANSQTSTGCTDVYVIRVQ